MSTVPEVNINKVDGKVVITLDTPEAEQLLYWLDRMDTGWLNDYQYLYFINFKERLSLMSKMQSSDVTIIEHPVAEKPLNTENNLEEQFEAHAKFKEQYLAEHPVAEEKNDQGSRDGNYFDPSRTSRLYDET